MFICFYCGRLMKYQVPHKCKDGFRKRKLKFIEYGTNTLDNNSRNSNHL